MKISIAASLTFLLLAGPMSAGAHTPKVLESPGQFIVVAGEQVILKLVRVDGDLTLSVGKLILAEIECEKGCDLDKKIDLRRALVKKDKQEVKLMVTGKEGRDIVLVYELQIGPSDSNPIRIGHIEHRAESKAEPASKIKEEFKIDVIH